MCERFARFFLMKRKRCLINPASLDMEWLTSHEIQSVVSAELERMVGLRASHRQNERVCDLVMAPCEILKVTAVVVMVYFILLDEGFFLPEYWSHGVIPNEKQMEWLRHIVPREV